MKLLPSATGIDIGSTATKAVKIENGVVIDTFEKETSGDMLAAAQDAYNTIGAISGNVVITGYGRKVAADMGSVVTEVTCHVRGALHYFPEITGLLDIGGQDAKAVRIVDGLPRDFALNDRCAAGTGRFLEFIANRLNLSPQDLGRLTLHKKNVPELSSTCTVFAESEVVGLLAEGVEIPAIAAALFNAIARRMATLAAKVHLDGKIALTGGGARYANLVDALHKTLGVDVVVPPEPHLIGALGAALIAGRINQ